MIASRPGMPLAETLSPEGWAERDKLRHFNAQIQKLPKGLLSDFDANRHPSPSAHNKTLQWCPGASGLMLYGPTGTGKSRSLLQLLKKLLWDDVYRGIIYVTEPHLGDRISALAFENVAALDQYVRSLETCAVLAIDDLGAFKPTERVACAVHRIIDSRYAEGLPLLISTNYAPQELQLRLLDETGRTLRRIQEMTLAITFFLEQKH